MIYLDYNATTPVDDSVLETMMPFFSKDFGNASAVHLPGVKAYKAVENAREIIAKNLCADKQEIIFTSGATESVNLAIKGLYEIYGEKRNHIITIKTEHSSVLNTCKSLLAKGAEIDFLDVDKNGLVNMDDLQKNIKSTTLLIAVMFANNETGVIQPIEKIGKLAKEKNIFFFCDAAQAVGKKLIDVNALNIDLMSFSAHKMYGPKGIGGLYFRRKNPRVNLLAQINGGEQERGLRSGTLNVPGIVGMAKAFDLRNDAEQIRQKKLRDRLENALLKIDGITANSKNAPRMENVSNLLFSNVSGKMFINLLSKTLAVSSGSACSAASNKPSHVLTAMGLNDEEAKNAIRFSLGKFTTENEIEKTIEIVAKTYLELRNNN